MAGGNGTRTRATAQLADEASRSVGGGQQALGGRDFCDVRQCHLLPPFIRRAAEGSRTSAPASPGRGCSRGNATCRKSVPARPRPWRDDVGVSNGDPGTVDQQAHDGLAVDHGLDEIRSRSAVPVVAARLPVAVFESLVVHSPIVDVRRRSHCAHKQAQQEPLDSSSRLRDHDWRRNAPSLRPFSRLSKLPETKVVAPQLGVNPKGVHVGRATPTAVLVRCINAASMSTRDRRPKTTPITDGKGVPIVACSFDTKAPAWP